MKASPTPWPWSSNRAARAAPWPRPSPGRRWKRPSRSWDRGEARAFGRICPETEKPARFAGLLSDEVPRPDHLRGQGGESEKPRAPVLPVQQKTTPPRCRPWSSAWTISTSCLSTARWRRWRWNSTSSSATAPKYNILLKDDKHFPYIRVDLAQDYPRLELVRKQARDGARYFGPYKGATAVREVLDVARMVFPIRTCNRVIRRRSPSAPASTTRSVSASPPARA